VAKYVILQFDDDGEASIFVQSTVENGLLVNRMAEDINREYGVWHFSPIVRAVFQRPTKFCDCASTGTNLKARGFTRGKKYGWWVCSICKKPTSGWAQGHEWFKALGRNLLPKTPQAPEYRGDGNWGAPHGEARVGEASEA
jgi:hypothetical protein